jgi:hypothetical protein
MKSLEQMVKSPKAKPVSSRAHLARAPERPPAALPKMTRGQPKLVLARGMALLASTCVRPLQALPVEKPDSPYFFYIVASGSNTPPSGVVGAAGSSFG